MAAVDAGQTQAQAAARFGVALRTVERYLARRRATGSLAATEQRHGPAPRVRQQLQAWLPERLAAAADATLAEHAAAFAAETGLRVSLASMSRAIAGLSGRDAATVRGAHVGAEILTEAVIVPLALASQRCAD